MKKKIIALILTAILPIISLPVFALTENPIEVKLDYDKMSFKLEDEVSGNRAHKIMLVVTQPDEGGELTEISDTDSISDINDKLYAVSSIYLEKNGNFSFEIPVKDGARVGFYGFRIGVTGIREDGNDTDEIYIFKGKKYYADEGVRSDIYKAFLSEDADIDLLINTYGKNTDMEVLGFDPHNPVYISHKTEVTQLFDTIKGEISFLDFEDVDKALSMALAIADINNGVIDKDTLASYKDILDLKTNRFYTDEVADEIAEKLNNFKDKNRRGFNGINDLNNEFDAAFFIAAVNRASREDITELVNGYDALGLSYEDLNPNEVNKPLTNGNFQTPDQFKTAFNASVAALRAIIDEKAEKEEQNSVHSRPSGGGGGGGITIADTPKKSVESADKKEKEHIFSDLDSVPWAVESIESLANMGVINGIGDGIFAPDLILKREEGAKLLVLALNMETDGRISAFSDVKIGQWYYPYVSTAYEEDILLGKGDGTFGVGESFTREDFCLMLFRAIGDKLIFDRTVTDFSDKDEISQYAAMAVEALSSVGIINGMGDGRFAPKECVSRAQAAKMIYNAIKLIEGGNAN